MELQTILERYDYDLDKTFTEILDRDHTQLSTEKTMADALSYLVGQRLDHIQSSSLASTDEGQKEMAFLRCEMNTWSLLDNIETSSSPLQKCSKIKDWISGIQYDMDLPDSLKYDPMEDEIDDEVYSLFTLPIGTPRRSRNTTPMTDRKRGIFLDDDDDDDDDDDYDLQHTGHLMETPSQRRRTTQDEDIKMEKVNESIYKSLRNGDLDSVIRISEENDEPWRITLIKSYVQRCKKIQSGESLELDSEDQRFWRSYCQGLVKKEGLGPYGKAVYTILLGEINNVLPVCETWEDTIWTYYNSRMEHTIDNMANTITMIADITILDKEHEIIANRRDSNLPRKHPNHFFHLVQTHILKHELKQLYQLAYQSKNDGSYFKAFIIRDDLVMRHQMDRFMAAFVVYARKYLKSSTKDSYSEQIILRYAKRNQYPPTFNPKTLAFFASNLDHELETELFSEFLNDFDGDSEERKLLVELGSQYNLNMTAILLRTYEHGMKRTSMDNDIICDKTNTEQFELDGQIPDNISQFLQALEWLLMEKSLYEQAIKETNNMVRKYLGVRKVYLAKKLVDAIPMVVVNHCILQSQGGFLLDDYLEEFQDHSSLLNCWHLFDSWYTLFKEKPDTTTDDLETLKLTLTWKIDLLRITEKLDARLQSFLTSSWLKDGNGSGTKPNDALRQIYITEAVIRLHHIQYNTKDFDTSPYTKKRDTLISLVASEKYGIYRDLVESGKMTFVFKTLNEQ